MPNKRIKICPWWMGYTLLLPTRKLFNDPFKLLSPYIKDGMAILDYGCAMGYFSIPMAKMVGKNGIVYCADIQFKMLQKLQKRAYRHNVSDNVVLLEVGFNYNPEKLFNKLDFVLLFAVVHEVSDKSELFKNIFSMLNNNGIVYFVEPKGHVKEYEFQRSINLAINEGFIKRESRPIRNSLSAILLKETN